MIKLLTRIDREMPWHPLQRLFLQTVAAIVIVAFFGGVRGAINVPILPYLLFIPSIMLSALLFGQMAGVVSVCASTLAAIYFFLPPDVGFTLQDWPQTLSVILFAIVSLGISFVAAQWRKTALDMHDLNRTLERRVSDEIEKNDQVNEALRQSQKLESIGQLTGGIAHDFNNILAGVSGSLELMRLNIGRERYDKVPRYLDTAEHATKRAAELTHRLLAFSRKQTLEPKRVCCNELIEAMADMLARTLGPGVVLHYDFAEKGLWYVRVDPVQLESSVLNLCLNSRDAMREGTITLTVQNLKLDRAQAEDRDLCAGDYVSISVTDTGTGIEPDVLARIFEPFYTTKAKGDGTGLGLSMVHGFARQSGGQVRVHSAVGVGTTVRILLPRYVNNDVTPVEAVPEHVEGARGETILVADDEPAIRAILEDALVEAGYRVILATGGQDAIDRLKQGRSLDLLVTDVGMPGVNGRAVADRARRLYPDIPILFITGFAATGLLPPEYLDDRKGIVTKPFALNALLKRVSEMIQH